MNKQKGYIDLKGLDWLVTFAYIGVIASALFAAYGTYWLFSHLVITIV